VCNTLGALRYLESLDFISGESKDLVESLIKVDPNLRPSAREALMHPWFKVDKNIIRNLLSINDQLMSNRPSEQAIQ
jgi:serine/threonine protein kinase